MKNIIILFVLFLTACNKSELPQDIREILAFGTMTELNKVDPEIEKDLLVRLYKLPKFEENCFVETHGICKYQYYLSVSTFDEYPDTNVYKLSHTGEISSITWIKESKSDYVEIELTFETYSKQALSNNKLLKNTPFKVKLKVDPIRYFEEKI